MSSYKNLVDTILTAPFWVQEALFMDVLSSFEEKLDLKTNIKTEDIYTLYVPELTYKGNRECETREHGHEPNLYKFMQSAMLKKRIVDITIDNFWTLNETSKMVSECIKNEYIKPTDNDVINASIYYMSGEIRLGEYVKRLNKIDIKELDDILRKQKQHNEQNPDSQLKIGEIMVDMGFVANKDIDKIIHTKSEAKKRYILTNENKPAAITPTAPNLPKTPANDELVKKLMTENKLLKDKLRAIFNIQNKHK